MRLLRRLWTLVRARRVDDEIRREIDFHLDMDAAERQRRGVPAPEARHAAARDLGGALAVHEAVRDARGLTFWDGLRQDVRFGVRTLRRSPGFSVAAIAILALGIGANTAMFSVLDGVLLKPLPFKNGDELVILRQSAPQSNVANAGVSIFELYDYRERLQSVRDLVEYHQMSFTLLNQGEPDRVDAAVVSANFFEMLGVKPLHGRTFVDHDDDLGSDAVLVLSYPYFKQRFGGDPSVVGRVFEMNNRPHTVVGVLPPFPEYPSPNDVYMPSSACPFRAGSERNRPQGHRSFAALNVFGRLAPGATLERATSEIAAAASGFAGRYATEYANVRGLTGRALGLEEQLVSGARSLVVALAAVTGLVLLIACANVANLALARTSERRRELAVRAALGAARGRLFRQLVTESLLLSIAGGLVGLGLAALSLDLLVDFVERFTSRTSQIGIDLGVLGYTVAASIVTGVLFGSAPALAAWKRGLVEGVRDGAAQAGDSRGRTRLRTTLVIAQVAVSFVLLVGAGLLIASFGRLSAVPVGYDTDRAITANLVGNFSRFNTPQRALQIHSDVLSRLRASPGVRAAAVTNTVPFTNLQPGIVSVKLEGAPGDQTQQQVQVDPNTASEGYFESLGIPILTGRSFRESDDASAPLVAVINTTMARAWQGRDPVGSRFLTPQPLRPSPNGEVEWVTVIGIVPDFKLYGIARDVEPQFYFSFRQGGFGGRVIVAANGDPYDLVPTIKAAVHGVDPQIPVEDIQTIADLRRGQLATPGLTAALLAIFAGVALVITLAGIAGVIGTTVSQRTREFGLRMALGATPGSVLRLVLRQGLVMSLVGVAIGVGGALAAGRVLASSLFATEPRDPLVLASVAGVFLLATLVAIWSPARRATSADPLRALRSD